MVYRSQLIDTVPGVEHGFGTREEPVANELRSLWEERRPRWKQVHGNRVVVVSQAAQECGDTDALVTWVRGLPIGVVTADCVPILLARRDGGAVAAIHAGWRGTHARIVRKVTELLLDRGERLANWVAAIGPAISGEVYEVGEELCHLFKGEFAEHPSEAFIPKPLHLDLVSLNRLELLSAGFSVDSVDLIKRCTLSSKSGNSWEFNSYRRDQSVDRQFSTILIQ